MSRATLILNTAAAKATAINWIAKSPRGTRIEFKAARRSLPQNSRFYAMLTDIASQLHWHGEKLPTDDWKLIFLDALRREARLVPSIDGKGWVNLGRRSSDLSKQEMSDVMEIMSEFGARHGVVFHDPAEARAA